MLSTFWCNEVLRLAYTVNTTTTFYVGISSTMPNSDGSNLNEPSGGNYTRMPITGFNAPSGGRVTNANTITFPTSTAEWFPAANTAAYYVIFDGADSSANVLGSGAFYTPMEIGENASLVIAAGLLSISLVDRPDD